MRRGERGKVDLTLTVLSYFDLKVDNPGYNLFMAHHIAKEALAAANLKSAVNNASGAPSLNTFIGT